MGWSVYYNGTLLRKVSDIKIEEELSNPMKIAHVLVRNESGDNFGFSHTIGNRLEIYRNGIKKFDGYVEDYTPDEGLNLELTGRSFEVLLLDERTSREDRYENNTGSAVINDLITKYSTKVSTDNIDYQETLSGTMRFSHDNLFKAIARVCNVHNKDFWVEYDGTDMLLNVGVRGDGDSGAPSKTLTAGKEIAVTMQRKGARDIINRQRVFGSGDGINQIQACVPYIDAGIPDNNRSQGFDGSNADCEHTEALESQTTYGIMEGRPVRDKSIVSTGQAIERAKQILDNHANPFRNLNVRMQKYVDINIGDTVRIIDTRKNVDEITRVKKLVHRNSIRRMDDLEIELTNPFDTTESEINIIKRDSDTESTHGLGATNIFQVQSYENCDTSYPLYVRFRLPDDIVTVNRVLLSFQVRPYRAYHQGLASSGAHSHTFNVKSYQAELSSLEGDIFLTGLRWDDFDDVMRLTSGDSATSRSIRGETTTETTSHNHEIDYGIIEETLNDTTVDVYANGTHVTEFSDGTTDYDITSFVSALGSWHSVEFRPVNNNMRIEANLYIKCYVESN